MVIFIPRSDAIGSGSQDPGVRFTVYSLKNTKYGPLSMLTTLGYMFLNTQLTSRSYVVVLYDYFESSGPIKSTSL